MSKESLAAFLKMAVEDEDLQHKLIQFAASQGFEFTRDDLSDADLESVSGGSSNEITAGKVNRSGTLFPDVTNIPPVPGSVIPTPFPNQGTSDQLPDPTRGTSGSGTTSPGGTST